MIKPILLLLFVTAGLVLLDQTNGKQTRGTNGDPSKKFCPSLLYTCKGTFLMSFQFYGKVCVPYWSDGKECQKIMTNEQIDAQCRELIDRPGLTHFKAFNFGGKKCSIGHRGA